MTRNVSFSVADVTDREVAAVEQVLRSGWLTTGPRTKEFEQKFANRVAASHAIAVNSCTGALHMALAALGVGPGDEVIIPTMTFAASGEVVVHLGARPVLVDVDAATHCIDVAGVEKALSPRTKVIMPVHFAGAAAPMDALLEIARSRGVAIVEDAAHAFPATHGGRPIGSIGDVTCFSFYATKTITTGEGGMATTERSDLADRMRILSLHGISKDAWKRYSAEGSWRYDILLPGFKYNMTDVAAAMGLVQLERAEEMRVRRAGIAERYRAALDATDTFETLEGERQGTHAWHLFVVKLRDHVLRIDRDQLLVELRQRGVGTSVHFIPLHMHPYYRKAWGYTPDALPIAADVARRTFSLPIYSKMSDDDVAHVIEAMTGIAASFRR